MANLPKGLTSSGGDIFTDASGATFILSDDRTKILSLDTPQLVFFQLYRSRLVIAIVLALALGYYGKNWFLGIGIGLFMFLLFELLFRSWLRPSLSVYKTLKSPYPKTGFAGSIAKQKTENLLKNVVLSIIMCGIFIWNLFEQSKQGFVFVDLNTLLNTVLSIVMIVGPGIYGLLCAREFLGR